MSCFIRLLFLIPLADSAQDSAILRPSGPDVGFIDAPAATDRTLAFAGHFLDDRQQTGRPSIDLRMVYLHVALLHYPFQVPIAQRVGHVPADADQDHIDQKAYPFAVEHVDASSVRAP